MGFDQYHEPPEELSARDPDLCPSLRLADRGGGGDRLVRAAPRVEAERGAKAIMRDAQGEEFKHFAMDLEFLLRRTPALAADRAGVLFQDGDIVEHGEAAEAALRR